jgi:hypothetical protein
MTLDQEVLQDLATRLRKGEHVVPTTLEEKKCYQVIRDLDHVSGHDEGSGTMQKLMNHEVWSLLSYIGAPSWYIMFSPADEKHPITLYYADKCETFRPMI